MCDWLILSVTLRKLHYRMQTAIIISLSLFYGTLSNWNKLPLAIQKNRFIHEI